MTDMAKGSTGRMDRTHGTNGTNGTDDIVSQVRDEINNTDVTPIAMGPIAIGDSEGRIVSSIFPNDTSMRDHLGNDLLFLKYGYTVIDVYTENGNPVLIKALNSVALVVYIIVDIHEGYGPWVGNKVPVYPGRRENQSVCGAYGDRLMKMVGYSVSGLVFTTGNKIQVMTHNPNGFDIDERMWLITDHTVKEGSKCICFPVIRLSHIKKIPDKVDPVTIEGIQKMRDLITNESSNWFIKLENSISTMSQGITDYGDLLQKVMKDTMEDIRVLRSDLKELRSVGTPNKRDLEDLKEVYGILAKKNEIVSVLPSEINQLVKIQGMVDEINLKIEESLVQFRSLIQGG